MPIQLNIPGKESNSFITGGIPEISNAKPLKAKKYNVTERQIEEVSGIPEQKAKSISNRSSLQNVEGYLKFLDSIDPTGKTSSLKANEFRQINGGAKEYEKLSPSDKKTLIQKREAFFKSDYFKKIQDEARKKGFNIPTSADSDEHEVYLKRLMINNPRAFKKEYKGLSPDFLSKELPFDRYKILNK